MRALGQHIEHVFGTNDREQVGLGVAVEGGQENMAPRLDQSCAGGDNAGRIRDVFEHFQAGHGIERAGHFVGQLFDSNLAVIDLLAAFKQVQLGNAERLFGKINAGDVGSTCRHAFGEQSAATADIEDTLAGQADCTIDPVKAQRVDVVQRLEFAVRVPPAVGKFSKFVEFGLIGVEHGGQWFGRKRKSPAMRGFSLKRRRITWCR
ncbi:hypothetical protein SDC9_148337 [bioreactor metagenome]|uniref:Uncharacterized protein n=1 Tax=bioreactor metagenome TaxID=1076179 RepID=A0A645EK91_9ZZZZ